MRTLEHAVDRTFNVAINLLIQDQRRIEVAKEKHGSTYAAQVGKENLVYARGMLYAFLDKEDFKRYARHRTRVLFDGNPTIYDDGFISALSRHLDEDSDRARVIWHPELEADRLPVQPGARPFSPERHYLVADVKLANYSGAAEERIRELVPDCSVEDSFFAGFYGDPDCAWDFSEEKVYRALLNDQYVSPGHRKKSSMRVYTALHTALATGKKTIAVRQTVEENDDLDMIETLTDPLTQNSYDVRRSPLGTGSIMQFGPNGLELVARLAPVPSDRGEHHLFSIRHPLTGMDVPIGLELRHYEYRADEHRVRPTYDSSGFMLSKMFSDSPFI